MISYTKKLNDNWALYPSVLIKNTDNHQQIDANLNIKLRNQIWFGASYRTSPDENNQLQEAFGPSFYLGIDLGRFFSIYSHDLSSRRYIIIRIELIHLKNTIDFLREQM